MLLTTSAACPFTVTATGELTCSIASVGNGWPGSTPGRVGPRPVACTVKTSPVLAGLAGLTGEKSEWNTAGPFVVDTICAVDLAITGRTNLTRPPHSRRPF